MSDSGQEKTEAPTASKLADARREGNVPKSTDLNAACILLGAVLVLYVFAEPALGALRGMIRTTLGSAHAANPARATDLVPLTAESLRAGALSIGPVLGAVVVIALAASLGQVGFLLTAKPLTPSLAKLNPLKGLKNLVGLRSGVRLAMSLVKVAVLFATAGALISMRLPQVMKTAELTAAGAFAAGAWLVFELALVLAVLLIVIAAADLAYQRWQHTADLRMTREDVKKDARNMNGDPEIKQRRQRIARQLAMQRIGAAVPGADVVVTNPTHYAVVLKYDNDTMAAPRVVAKGADHLALQIRKLAALHGVPILERKPLARALYADVEVGREVPEEHYAAVAEILAYVYRLAGRAA